LNRLRGIGILVSVAYGGRPRVLTPADAWPGCTRGAWPEDAAWASEQALSRSGEETLEALWRVVRDRGAAPLWGTVPCTARLVAALPEMRRVLLASVPHAV
jgi:hypothetical protein